MKELIIEISFLATSSNLTFIKTSKLLNVPSSTTVVLSDLSTNSKLEILILDSAFTNNENKIQNDKNTIIYGHNRLDKTMFVSLKNILTKEWLNNKKNHIINLYTEDINTQWEVFSVYHIKTTSDYLQTEFKNKEDFNKFINMILKRSVYNFNKNISSDDIILTLSSCYKKRKSYFTCKNYKK